MTTPTLHLLALSDGRLLEVAEVGDPHAPAVVVHNGTPFALALLTEHRRDALARGLRLITYARPGYGRSTRDLGRSVASAASDTAQLADALAVERFATWGISGGGPHALACGALLGERVVAVASLAGPAPFDAVGLDFLDGMGQDNIDEFSAAAQGEQAITAYLEAQASSLRDADVDGLTEAMGSLLSGPDRAVLASDLGREITTFMLGGARDGLHGWIDDDLAFVKPWGFDPVAIQSPLQIWQGEQDLMVPLSHGQWLARHMIDADARLSAQDGHLTLYADRVADVHAWMAKHLTGRG
ncbi:MAG: alpha/beta hydrolase [Firmicutes bacterium]|nr:alpha/beta hydrolase [Bacillota bacterium]